MILHEHDNVAGTVITLRQKTIVTFGHADDTALFDDDIIVAMMPPRFESLMEYWDNETADHDNLKNLSELLPVDSSF